MESFDESVQKGIEAAIKYGNRAGWPYTLSERRVSAEAYLMGWLQGEMHTRGLISDETSAMFSNWRDQITERE